MSVDLKGAVKFAAVVALLASAWFVVRMLKPREAELSLIDTRDGDFGDMTSAAQKRAASGSAEGDVSGLDMVPTSSLPLSGPEKPAPAPEPAPVPAQTAAAPASEPEPPAAPTRPARREKPLLQRTESTTGGQTATSSAFMAAPEDADPKDKKR